jgi:hypothetical protein
MHIPNEQFRKARAYAQRTEPVLLPGMLPMHWIL